MENATVTNTPALPRKAMPGDDPCARGHRLLSRTPVPGVERIGARAVSWVPLGAACPVPWGTVLALRGEGASPLGKGWPTLSQGVCHA